MPASAHFCSLRGLYEHLCSTDGCTRIPTGTPDLPDGWTATGDNTFAIVDPGQTVTATLSVTPAASVKPTSYTLRLDATYTARGAAYSNDT